MALIHIYSGVGSGGPEDCESNLKWIQKNFQSWTLKTRLQSFCSAAGGYLNNSVGEDMFLSLIGKDMYKGKMG